MSFKPSMGVVILGGLLSSTFLNMLVVPVLFRLFGRPPARPAAAVPSDRNLPRI